MKVYENPRVADWAIKQVRRKMMDGQGRTGPWHASEIYQCARKTILHRNATLPYDRGSILRFAMGFAIQEWFFGPEKGGKELLGIILSPDRLVQGNVLEFKSTRNSYEKYQRDGKKLLKNLPKVKFDPLQLDQWTKRVTAYATAFGVRKAHILVLFLFANDLHAWTYEFDDQDIAEAREDIETRRLAMDEHHNAYTADGTLPPVTTRTGPWECGPGCPYYVDYCQKDLEAAGLDKEDE